MANEPTQPPFLDDYSGVREYIGARYVPLFANPPEWDNSRGYEPLTIVLHEGNSYTSAQTVPPGIDINNSEFWMLTGNYNAQIEQYRKEVHELDKSLQEEITNRENADTEEITNRENADTALRTELSSAIQTEAQERQTAINAEITNRTAADENLQSQITALDEDIHKTELVVFGDSWGAGDYSDWVTKMGNDLGLNLHNYCVGSTRESNIMNQYTAFKSDIDSGNIDPDKVKYIVLIYGVNDQWTYPVSATTSYTALQKFFNAVNSEFTTPPLIHHFINFTWGFTENSPLAQGLYWNMNVCVNLERTFKNYVYYNMMSWFNAQDMLEANNFHLNANARDRQLRNNIERVLRGYEPVKRPSWYQTINYTAGDTSKKAHLMQDITDDGVEFTYILENTTTTGNTISAIDGIPNNNVAPLAHGTISNGNNSVGLRLAGASQSGGGQIGTYIRTVSAMIQANPNSANIPYQVISGKLTWLSGAYN